MRPPSVLSARVAEQVSPSSASWLAAAVRPRPSSFSPGGGVRPGQRGRQRRRQGRRGRRWAILVAIAAVR
eukprot:7112321-Lingulodinium_polyedra.AAC.1